VTSSGEAQASTPSTQVLPVPTAPIGPGAPAGQGGSAPRASRSGRASQALAAFAVLLLAGGGVSAAVLLTSGSAHGHKETTKSTTTATTSSTLSAVGKEAEIRSRQEVVGVLREYEKDYTHASAEALGGLLASDVRRHGLAVGGCSEVSGRRAVLDAYESQFAADGRITYRLLGLEAGSVHLEGSTASTDMHYLIPSTGNTGYVDFTLTREAVGWRIDGINATCHPSYS
jgi:hypothetical protein